MKKFSGVLLELRPRISVTFGALAFVVAVAYVWAQYQYPEHREIIRNLGASISIAAAVTMAFYVGWGFRLNVISEKLGRTIAFARCWNDPHFFYARRAIRETIQAAQDGQANDLVAFYENIFRADQDKCMNVLDVLNYFEEMSIYINRDVFDEELLREFFQTMVIRYYSQLQPWIEKVRRERGDRLYRDFENLYNKWRRA